ncbi:hypothetical protein B0J13DRAFT_453966 [Dactylonectria estremocensis]|uniref:Uncharacterized protein n=1 Tax=Dactylonectria estremocensis TaxID=1079267 RepID=A0A9P9E0P8_9HYPO|nr:hypothetical protein B0J13DRAFT_453966 [Dactylonectria estremocensis]
MNTFFVTLLALAGVSIAMPNPQNYVSNGQCPAGCDSIISENDNPDPHQLYFFQQMTSNHQCGTEGCEISKSDVQGQTVSVHADVSAGGWISAGFEVSQYEESGEVQTCYGEAGDTICVFWRTANTIYTANIQSNVCCRAGDKSPIVITSPNKNEVGSGSICGRNEQCHTKGHSYWNNMERQNGGVTVAGGPQEWPFGNTYAGIVPDLDEVPAIAK